MLTPSRRSTSALPDAPDPALDEVDVEAEVVDVQLGVGRELAGDQHDPAAVAAYGGQRLVRAGSAGVGVIAWSG